VSEQVHIKTNYEIDRGTFSAEAYKVEDYPHIAFRVRGWEVRPDGDTEWDGIEKRTGRVIVVMIGDDRKFAVDPADVEPIPDLDYCNECGQMGCAHDGRERP
jgi:hypothetical protein